MANEFRLDGVVPWGREADEYEALFALGDVPASARVLDCGGGPASFTAEWRARGRRVTAADPLYAFESAAIRARFDAARAPMREGMARAHAEFVWEFYESEDEVVTRRERALARFCADRDAHPERYVAASLPVLPFASDSFELVLCSHLLFLYSAELSLELHVESLREMLRVGAEVRVFPLLDLDGAPSRHLEPALAALRAEARAERVTVPFEFRRGSREMLRVTRAAA
jgi:SAM-dependent methyltransferase